jgi:hypothetical protein
MFNFGLALKRHKGKAFVVQQQEASLDIAVILGHGLQAIVIALERHLPELPVASRPLGSALGRLKISLKVNLNEHTS